jgi:hypothetical protein
MMLKLIMRDRAIRLLPPWLLLGVLIGFMLSASQQDAVRHGLTVGRHGYQGFRYIAHLPWGLIGLYLLYAGVTTRCDRFEMTLPIRQRKLWLSRVLALTLAVLAIIGTAAATLLLRNRLEGFQVVGRTQVESLLAQLTAASMLAVMLARWPNPALREIPFSPGNILYLALVWLGTLGVIFVLAGDSPGYALLPAAATLALGLGIYRSLPELLVIVPREPEADGPGPKIFVRARGADGVPMRRDPGDEAASTSVATHVGFAGRGSRWLLHTTIWRTCYGHWVAWLIFALLVALGLGAARPRPDNSLNLFWLLILYWLMLSALFGFAVSRLPTLDPLPVSRRLIFSYMVLPGLLVACVGYLGAKMIRMEEASNTLMVDYREHPVVHDRDVRVPFAFWEIGWKGDPAAVEESYVPPWEEPHYPWSVTLFKGLPPVLYSPYHVPEGSSPGFVAEQLSRAVEAVYGTRISSAEIQQHYLTIGADGSTSVRPGGVTLLEDYPRLRLTSWMGSAPVVVLLIGLPWLLYVALTVRGGFASATAARRPWGYFLLVALTVVCLLGSLWSYSAGLTAEWKVAALGEILMRKLAAALPGSRLVQWGITIALLGGGYLLAQVRFERIETTAVARRDFDRV